MSGLDGALLAAIIDGAAEAIVVMTPDGAITGWNPAAEKLYGFTAREAQGQSIAILNRPGEEDHLQHAKAASRGETLSFEAEHVRRDGSRVELAVTLAPIRDAEGTVTGVWCLARDVTARNQAERERERLTDATELTDAIISLDLDARVRHWSPGAARLVGFRAEEVVGLGLDELNALSGEPEDAAARWRRLMPLVLSAETPFVHELQRRHRDGTVVDLLGKIIPWHRNGRVVGVTGLLLDITERKRAEREFVRLAEAAQYGTDALVSTDLDGFVRHWNGGAERLFGVSAQEAIGKRIDEVNALTGEPEQANARARDLIARIRRGEPAYHVEAQRRRKDGVLVDVVATVTPWHVDGRLAGVTTTSLDITERKRVEQADARLAAIVESSDDAIIGKTLDGQITSWNPAAEQIYGYSAAEAVGNNVSMLLAPGQEDELRWLLASVARGELVSRLETTRRRGDGRVIEVSLTASPIRDRQGQVVGAATIARDISKRKRAERERERALADLEDAQRIARVGSWSWDPRTEQVSWSAQMYAIFGRDPANGPPSIREFLAYAHPEDRERVADAYAQALAGEAAFEIECRIVADDGVVQHTVHALGHADPARASGYLGTVQDITRQRRAERERLELLRASERAVSANRAKSEFLARMSHELRTPLNAIIGFSQVLQLERLEPRHNQDIGHILTAGNHLLALVNEVLDLARIESGQMTISPEPVALANTIHDALALLAPIARERHVSLGIDTDGLAHDGHVHADRNRVKQVLLNVLSNAIKYNRPGGRVDVSFQITKGARVRTMIADTGIGISPEHLDKLFEPFERLGAEQTDVEGTGLGLALSKGLIEAMGGTIEVQSTVGVGTTFVIDLAAAERPAGERQPSPGDQALAELGGPDAKPQLILYIEDNLSNLTLVERILERQPGVELISAMQGTLGLELAHQHRPDLIVLDLHLPDMPGTEVLTRLKTDPITREIPVIVLTADASGRQSQRVRQLGAIDYLTKPLDVPKFIEIIANNLADH